MKQMLMKSRHAMVISMLLVFSILPLQGQIFFINENFSTASGSTPPSGWVNNIISGNASFDTWRFNNPGGRTLTSPISSPAAIFDSDVNSSGGGAENVALESPAFNTTGYSSVFLTFDHVFNGIYNSTDGIYVEVFNGTSWNTVFSSTSATPISGSPLINISTNASNRTGVKVRFRFVGDWSWFWIVDNVRVYANFDHDMAAVSTELSGKICGLANDSVVVNLRNNGALSASNFTVRARITGTLAGSPINSLYSATFNGTIGSGGTGRIAIPCTNTLAGGNINILAYTELSGEQNRTNDTAKTNNLNVVGTPAEPNASNVSACGTGRVSLTASAANGTDSLVWYNSSSATSPVGTGSVFQTPILSPGNYNYFVAGTRGRSNASLSTTFAAGNGQAGAMFDVVASRSIRLDSIALLMQTTGSTTVRIYYKLGTYAGFEMNAGAWTTLGDATINVASPGVVNAPIGGLDLAPGQTYGIFVFLVNGGTLSYTNGTNVYSNADLTMTLGVGAFGPFQGTFTPRTWNGTFFYSTSGCEGPRKTVNVNVQPKPAGTALIPGPIFKATANSGILQDPTIIASPDTLSFELLPPTGFSNSQFAMPGGWAISSLSVTTINGNAIPSGDTSTVLPSSSSNGRMFFRPSAAITDSTIRIRTTVVNLTTGCDTVLEKIIFVAPRPVASFSANAACEGFESIFINNSTITSGTMSFKWYFGDGDSSILFEPRKIYAATGTYTVRLEVTSNFGYTTVSTLSYGVNQIPQVEFSSNNTCAGDVMQLTNTTLMPPGNATYHWDFGDGTTAATTANTTHIYNSIGTYEVTYTINVEGCIGKRTKIVTNSPRANVSFTASTACNEQGAVFTNNSNLQQGTMGFEWNFGDGNRSGGKNPNHVYTNFGTYTVILKASTDLGCVDSFSLNVDIKQSPTISISASQACAGDEVTFTNNTIVPAGAVNVYDWTFGDGTVSTQSDPKHTYSGSGSYKVTLKAVSSNGCEDIWESTIMVGEKPKAGFTSEDVCQGRETRFFNSSTASNPSAVAYSWDFGNGSGSNAKDTALVFAQAGSFIVNLIATLPNGCSSASTKTVEVFPIPSASFTGSSAFRGDGSFAFNGPAGSGLTYQWFLGDGGRSSSKDPIHTYTLDGNYSVRLVVVSDKGCSNESTQGVSVLRTSVDKAATSNWNLYPNPNTGKFSIASEVELSNNPRIIVFNQLGQEVDFTLERTNNRTLDLSLKNGISGHYLLRIEDGATVNVFKFTVH